ncbi:uncharacterized protein LOC142324090 isoform X2 [Lycorma delicatula]|uniref:uncharacterized protein LOC142324090 isoform X2 n=1 Tax=Lycorma delicatula TaxID=130591 RepID=UPI003F513725
MAKEDYILLFFLFSQLVPNLLCNNDDAGHEPITEEYYDYKTELPFTTTTDNILIQTLQKFNLSRENTIKNKSSNALKNYNDNILSSQNKYTQSESFIPQSKYNSSNNRFLPEDNLENITIEFNNKHIAVNSRNTEYEVDQKINQQIDYGKDEHNKTQSESFENSNTTQVKSKSNRKVYHPCSRECSADEQSMTCYYKFNVEWYYAMSKACFNCSNNESDCYRPDCISANGIKRPIIVVDRKLPGPSIEVCLGDRVIVDVHNQLMEESTSIHWHGHHQRGSPYMDGVPFITQCPIPPHNTFRYTYVAATPGTHFWHSHSGCQRTDGVVGNMIIRTPRSQDPHSHLYDEDLNEHIMNIMDWAHELGVSMFVAHYHSDGDNKPESILVNGRGRYFMDSINVTSTPLAVFNVKQGLRYRFRVINAGNQNCPIEISIDNHTLTAINSDGGNFEPVEGAALVTYAGERWDFIVKASGEIKNYWIRFKGLMDCDERFTKAHQVAILRYVGAPKEEPHEHLSYFGPDKTGLIINAMNVRLDDPKSRSIPELTAIDTDNDPSLKQNADHQFYLGYDFYPVNSNKYHKPTLYGFLDGNTYNANHPFHLHGHPFRVIGMDKLGENTSVEIVRNLDKAGLIWRNLKNAPSKDSVTVPDGGYTIVRFHATNPGYWLFHCHLEFHVEVGMALIFKIGEHSQFPPVPQGFPTCGDYLYPKLPGEDIKKWDNRDNEVNFGEDYGITHNATHNHQIKDSQKQMSKDSFKLFKLWQEKSAANTAVISVVKYKFKIEHLLFFTLHLYRLLH